MQKKYDSTVARIAGNLLSGVIAKDGAWANSDLHVQAAVEAARAIVAEVQRTEPEAK
jgi:hypothetical protein